MSNLLEEKKIILLDPLLRSNSSLEKIESLLNYDKNLFSTGFNYLARKRARKYSSYSNLYNLLDIYHYVLFENSKSILMDQNIDAYITSSGVLSRNSWILIKYGEFVSGLNEIPHDWSARTSTVPAFLAIASKYFQEDYSQMKDFFEEGRSIARMILRGLLEIPEMKDCHENPHNRKDLFRRDPTINISNEILHLIHSFEKDYYHIVNPGKPKIISVSNEDPVEEIDLKNLLNWIKDPDIQKRAHQTVIEEVNNLTIGIRPLDWKTYIAPIGDDAYEILSIFDRSIDG